MKGAEYGWCVESGCARGVLEVEGSWSVRGEGGHETGVGSVVNGILLFLTNITYNGPQSILSDSFWVIFFKN